MTGLVSSNPASFTRISGFTRGELSFSRVSGWGTGAAVGCCSAGVTMIALLFTGLFAGLAGVTSGLVLAGAVAGLLDRLDRFTQYASHCRRGLIDADDGGKSCSQIDRSYTSMILA